MLSDQFTVMINNHTPVDKGNTPLSPTHLSDLMQHEALPPDRHDAPLQPQPVIFYHQSMAYLKPCLYLKVTLKEFIVFLKLC